jgi:hypothetical protein
LSIVVAAALTHFDYGIKMAMRDSSVLISSVATISLRSNALWELPAAVSARAHRRAAGLATRQRVNCGASEADHLDVY